MASTITAFATFVPGTKAKSSEVNTAFSNFRGDIVPINSDTITASNLTHKLGTSDHRWSLSHIEGINFGQTTASWQIVDATTTVGNWTLNEGHTSGSERFSVAAGYNQTAEITQQFTFKWNGVLLAYNNIDGPKVSTRNCTINTLRYCMLTDGVTGSATAFEILVSGTTATTFSLTGTGSISNGYLTLTAFSVTSSDYITINVTAHNSAADCEFKLF